MAELALDEQGRPVPQYLNAAGTEYQEWKGDKGAGRVLLWGPDGTALLTVTNPGHIKVLESALPTGAATQDTLAAILSKIIIAPATATNQVAIKGAVETINDKLDNVLLMQNAVPWTVLATSSPDEAVVAQKDAVQDEQHCILGFTVVLRGAAASNDTIIEVKSDATVLIRDVIGEDAVRGSRVHYSLPLPLRCDPNEDAVLSVAAAGTSAITELTLIGFTISV